MTSMIHDEPVALDIRQRVSGPPLPPGPEGKPEFKLNPGERYGWWVENDREEERRQCATVHGAVNNFMMPILLDTGVTLIMIGLDLALKTKLNSQKRIKVSGLGGVPSYITSSAQIKISLGWRVVYVMDVWVTNIGEGVDVLLGIDFMFSAGVRLGIREGMVGLSDEESILMYGYTIRRREYRDIPVCPFEDCICDPENVQTWPSNMDNVARSKMSYGQTRGSVGHPNLLFSTQDPIKVVNVSDRDCWIDPRTPVARIAEYGNIPIVGQFIIQENTLPAKARVRQEAYKQMLRDTVPPAVMILKYKLSTKLLVRPREPERAQVTKIVEGLQPQRDAEGVESAEDAATKLLVRPREPERAQVTKIVEELQPQRDTEGVESAEDAAPGAHSPNVIGSPMAVEVSAELVTLDANARMAERLPIRDPVGKSQTRWLRDLNAMHSRMTRVQKTPISGYLRLPCLGHHSQDLIRHTPVGYATWLDDLSPECDIEAADVGEPGESTEAQEMQLKVILKRHQKFFLGDRNAAPPPARGVICDLDVGDARPVAQGPRSVGPHLAIKAYKLLKKLLEATLIEHSESPWASPIVIVLKKNGVDIRMCIDYRVVNSFIQLSNYPLPLINDLITGFEGMMWLMSLDMASDFWVVRMTERANLISAFTCPFGHFQWDVLDYLKLDPQLPSDETNVGRSMTQLVEQMTVFRRNIPAPSQMGSVLWRNSYIDDVAHGAPTWDQLCGDLDALLYRLRYWSEFGSVSYRTSLMRLVLKEYSFLGSLNYYHKFIEDYAVVAASLYELTDDHVSFEILKKKIVSTPLLRHPDRTKPFVMIPHANQWAACSMHDGLVQHVRFTGRVLSDAELKYHIAEKEVLAVMRVLHVFKYLIEGCPLIIHSTFSVEVGHQFQDRRRPSGAMYDLEIRKVSRDEDGLAAIMGARITPREHLDEVAEVLILAKGCVKPPPVVSVDMLSEEYSGVVLSFNGAAKTFTRKGSCGCILWQLPEWKVLNARGYILDGVNVNDAEYFGLLKGLAMALERGIQDIVVGDSRIVIQQVQVLINCNQPNIQRRLAEYEALKKRFQTIRLVHMKREFNQALIT
ncbi:LOW QUALITY PROTEIN: reverse transcriptase [Phytophthora megakarya]|uniref:Reverse transcriptase n=1 Tax=Phytophthora megakarya TaxID=4795 RepID=A0A225VB62_9STRA|nr:LOW QUALITY PROTEIN: reverse transcriptase [Phytophthora megakarya]